MIYTKDNIDGLSFQVGDSKTVYNVKVRTNDVLISWFNGSSSSSYKIEIVLSHLNDKA